MKVHYRNVSIRPSLVVVLLLTLLLMACSAPNTGSITPAPQATSVSTPDTATGATATVEPPAEQSQEGNYPYPGMAATPMITVTIEAYPTP
jgi:uncharacterized lipoprotein YajG